MLGNLRFWVLWVISSTVAGAVGWLLSAAALIFTFGAIILFMGSIVGFLIGIVQRYVLHRTASRGRVTNWADWLRLSTIAGELGILTYLLMVALVFQSADVSLRNILAVLVGSAVAGGFQSQMLRKIGSDATLWILSSIVGWTAGAIVGANVANSIVGPLDNPDPGMPSAVVPLVFIAGTIATAIASAVTGIGMAWLLRAPISEPAMPKAK
jgi:hypothetical protein